MVFVKTLLVDNDLLDVRRRASVASLLHHAADEHHRPALVCNARRLTYGEPARGRGW